jgi:hypothetical protein
MAQIIPWNPIQLKLLEVINLSSVAAHQLKSMAKEELDKFLKNTGGVTPESLLADSQMAKKEIEENNPQVYVQFSTGKETQVTTMRYKEMVEAYSSIKTKISSQDESVRNQAIQQFQSFRWWPTNFKTYLDYELSNAEASRVD